MFKLHWWRRRDSNPGPKRPAWVHGQSCLGRGLMPRKCGDGMNIPSFNVSGFRARTGPPGERPSCSRSACVFSTGPNPETPGYHRVLSKDNLGGDAISRVRDFVLPQRRVGGRGYPASYPPQTSSNKITRTTSLSIRALCLCSSPAGMNIPSPASKRTSRPLKSISKRPSIT